MSVKPNFSCFASGYSIFDFPKVSECLLLASDLQLSTPEIPRLVPRNSSVSASISGMRSLIQGVFSMRGITKICSSVIHSVSADVIHQVSSMQYELLKSLCEAFFATLYRGSSIVRLGGSAPFCVPTMGLDGRGVFSIDQSIHPVYVQGYVGDGRANGNDNLSWHGFALLKRFAREAVMSQTRPCSDFTT